MLSCFPFLDEEFPILIAGGLERPAKVRVNNLPLQMLKPRTWYSELTVEALGPCRNLGMPSRWSSCCVAGLFLLVVFFLCLVVVMFCGEWNAVFPTIHLQLGAKEHLVAVPPEPANTVEIG